MCCAAFLTLIILLRVSYDGVPAAVAELGYRLTTVLFLTSLLRYLKVLTPIPNELARRVRLSCKNSLVISTVVVGIKQSVTISRYRPTDAAFLHYTVQLTPETSFTIIISQQILRYIKPSSSVHTNNNEKE